MHASFECNTKTQSRHKTKKNQINKKQKCSNKQTKNSPKNISTQLNANKKVHKTSFTFSFAINKKEKKKNPIDFNSA